jgi:hypothetical protein
MSPLSVEKIKSLLKGAYLLESTGIYTNLKALFSRRGLKSEF